MPALSTKLGLTQRRVSQRHLLSSAASVVLCWVSPRRSWRCLLPQRAFQRFGAAFLRLSWEHRGFLSGQATPSSTPSPEPCSKLQLLGHPQ